MATKDQNYIQELIYQFILDTYSQVNKYAWGRGVETT